MDDFVLLPDIFQDYNYGYHLIANEYQDYQMPVEFDMYSLGNYNDNEYLSRKLFYKNQNKQHFPQRQDQYLAAAEARLRKNNNMTATNSYISSPTASLPFPRRKITPSVNFNPSQLDSASNSRNLPSLRMNAKEPSSELSVSPLKFAGKNNAGETYNQMQSQQLTAMSNTANLSVGFRKQKSSAIPTETSMHDRGQDCKVVNITDDTQRSRSDLKAYGSKRLKPILKIKSSTRIDQPRILANDSSFYHRRHTIDSAMMTTTTLNNQSTNHTHHYAIPQPAPLATDQTVKNKSKVKFNRKVTLRKFHAEYDGLRGPSREIYKDKLIDVRTEERGSLAKRFRKRPTFINNNVRYQFMVYNVHTMPAAFTTETSHYAAAVSFNEKSRKTSQQQQEQQQHQQVNIDSNEKAMNSTINSDEKAGADKSHKRSTKKSEKRNPGQNNIKVDGSKEKGKRSKYHDSSGGKVSKKSKSKHHHQTEPLKDSLVLMLRQIENSTKNQSDSNTDSTTPTIKEISENSIIAQSLRYSKSRRHVPMTVVTESEQETMQQEISDSSNEVNQLKHDAEVMMPTERLDLLPLDLEVSDVLIAQLEDIITSPLPSAMLIELGDDQHPSRVDSSADSFAEFSDEAQATSRDVVTLSRINELRVESL